MQQRYSLYPLVLAGTISDLSCKHFFYLYNEFDNHTLYLCLQREAELSVASEPAIRVSNYKSSTLETGERGILIIGSTGVEHTVSSSSPETVAVEWVLAYWVTVAKAGAWRSATGEIFPSASRP